MVTVISLNLWNINEPYDIRMSRVQEYLIQETPDMVLLQEVSPYGENLQLSDCIPKGYNYLFEPAGSWMGRLEGTAICSRHPIVRGSCIDLPMVDGDAPRRLLTATTTIGGRRILLASAHLAFQIENSNLRSVQATMIAKHLKQLMEDDDAATWTILGVDANSEPMEEPYEILTSVGLNDAAEMFGQADAATFSKANPFASPALNPGRRIDYVFVSSHMRVSMFELIFCERESLVSDHYGLLVRISSSQ
ncbi:endonuclease/exonuclease/phosphatase family protein [Nocardia wallacei]|uniref:endonuclease/exonuclease/phosphatase family protein n=1 Tax=Nocardia wallacei TaxID=480035 RepID=UPI002455244B|nr:endonuclease/exonuclease/phosphatase family protein [Nocardia wallacei]